MKKLLATAVLVLVASTALAEQLDDIEERLYHCMELLDPFMEAANAFVESREADNVRIDSLCAEGRDAEAAAHAESLFEQFLESYPGSAEMRACRELSRELISPETYASAQAAKSSVCD